MEDFSPYLHSKGKHLKTLVGIKDTYGLPSILLVTASLVVERIHSSGLSDGVREIGPRLVEISGSNRSFRIGMVVQEGHWHLGVLYPKSIKPDGSSEYYTVLGQFVLPLESSEYYPFLAGYTDESPQTIHCIHAIWFAFEMGYIPEI